MLVSPESMLVHEKEGGLLKFSRNPTSGQLEIYSDEGVYLGIVSTMGDDIQETAEDGGPGSGNWGHKGRPGHVGGSGKGGGSQYRGGNGNVGYFGSRKDWMNGLSGDDQHRAARFIANRKRDLNQRLEVKKKIQNMVTRGFLTQQESEERIKKDHLDQLSEATTVEEYVMKAGSKNDKEELLNHVQGGRRWKDNANKLIQENWDENDKKLASALADKYGRSFVGGAEIPDDSSMTDKWEPDDLECWYDLKAKALELPTSGKEAPDELQYEAGIKERPAPKKIGVPATREDNEKYVDNLPEEDKQKFIHIMQENKINPYTFGGDINMNYAEARLLDSGAYNQDQRLEIARYLSLKDQALGGNWFKQLSEFKNSMNDTIGNLPYSGSEPIMELMEQLLDEQKGENQDATIENMGDILEMSFLQDENVPSSVKNSYLRLKAISLGYASRDNNGQSKYFGREVYKYVQKRKEYMEEEKKFGTLRKNFKQDRAKREESYAKANTSEEIATAMGNSGMFRNGGTAELKKTDVKCARDVAKSYEMVLDRYPFLVGKLDGVDESETNRSTVYASCSMRVAGKVHLNASDGFFGNLTSLIEKYQQDVRTGYHPAGTDASSIATHEIGHALDGFLSGKGINGSRSYSTDANAFSGVLRRSVLRKLKMTKSVVYREASRYAAKDAYEWFAECFAEGMHSPNPRPMAAEMMRQLDEILRKEGLLNA